MDNTEVLNTIRRINENIQNLNRKIENNFTKDATINSTAEVSSDKNNFEKSNLEEVTLLNNEYITSILANNNKSLYTKPWCRIDIVSKEYLLNNYVHNNIDSNLQSDYKKIMLDLLSKGNLNKKSDITYDPESQKVTSINAIEIVDNIPTVKIKKKAIIKKKIIDVPKINKDTLQYDSSTDNSD